MDKVMCRSCKECIEFENARAEIVRGTNGGDEQWTIILGICPECNEHWVRWVENKYTVFLDDLRESGITNMWGAVPYLTEMYPELTYNKAKGILLEWIRTFGERKGETDAQSAR